MTQQEVIAKIWLRLDELGHQVPDNSDSVTIPTMAVDDPVIHELSIAFTNAYKEQKLAEAQAKIWRYMDFAKFVALLSKKALWFARADTMLDDPLEAFSEVIPYVAPVTPNSSEELYSHVARSAYHQLKDLNKKLFINCWIKRDEQSIAMWKLYATYERGVAIQSTIQNVEESIRLPDGVDRELLNFGAVVYTADQIARARRDLKENSPIAFGEIAKPAFAKRSCFDYEQEWRAVLLQWNSDLSPREEPGVELEVDLERLIEDVWVSPVAEPFFREAVDWVMAANGWNRKTKQTEWPAVTQAGSLKVR